MTQTTEELLQQAIDTCGELIAVLTQYMRGRRLKEEVAEEIADVSIMMRQLRLIFGTVNEIGEVAVTQSNKAMNPNGYRREIRSNFAGEATNNQSI